MMGRLTDAIPADRSPQSRCPEREVKSGGHHCHNRGYCRLRTTSFQHLYNGVIVLPSQGWSEGKTYTKTPQEEDDLELNVEHLSKSHWSQSGIEITYGTARCGTVQPGWVQNSVWRSGLLTGQRKPGTKQTGLPQVLYKWVGRMTEYKRAEGQRVLRHWREMRVWLWCINIISIHCINV